MVNSSFHLFQLQKIDNNIDAVSKNIIDIEYKKKDDSVLIALENEFKQQRKLLETAQLSYNEIAEKIRTKKNKIEQSESSLYSGKIKNPKELQDLQVEIQSLKQSIMNLEEIQLQQLMKFEENENEVNDAQQRLLKEKLNSEQLKIILSTDEIQQKKDLERLFQEKKALLDQVTANNLIIYNGLRKTKNGIAVTVIEDGCCQTCGNTLTPSDCQTAKSPTLMASCNSCGRILYAG
ncbi:MAG: hypothetical protein NTZ74_06670 [Chloroflexi bacterium]|nr:hypothetical protein [Chloroflexota bacterium]